MQLSGGGLEDLDLGLRWARERHAAGGQCRTALPKMTPMHQGPYPVRPPVPHSTMPQEESPGACMVLHALWQAQLMLGQVQDV